MACIPTSSSQFIKKVVRLRAVTARRQTIITR